MKITQIEDTLSKIKTGPSKWELDNIIWPDRFSDPTTLVKFLNRIKYLSTINTLTIDDQRELAFLEELLEDMEDDDISDLFDQTDDEAKDRFIEDLARHSAIEVLTAGKISYEAMNTACKLTSTDFILCAKRTQDLLNSIQGLVIKGETLSKDVAGA